jgi:hypothetical protein
VHFVDLDIGIDTVANAGPSSSDAAERADFLAPLPNIVGFANFKLADRWRWNNRVGWFGLDIDEYNGDFVTFSSSLEYDFNDRFGIGAGYSLIDLDLDIDNALITEIYRIDYDGPFAFASLRF